MSSRFAAATAVRRLGHADAAAAYHAEIDPDWSIGEVPNGGYLLAILARAASDAAGGADPLTVSGQFLRPPGFGPARVDVEITKRGRQVSAARATLRQEGSVRVDALVTLGTLPAPGAAPGRGEWPGPQPPPLPPPETCVRAEHRPNPIALADMVDHRLDPATAPYRNGPRGLEPTPTGEPLLRGWQRLADGAEPDPFFLILAVDAVPPTVFNVGAYGWAPTVELTVLLRARPAPGWICTEARATLVHAGWFDEEATLWDQTGALVAQSRQLALIGSG